MPAMPAGRPHTAPRRPASLTGFSHPAAAVGMPNCRTLSECRSPLADDSFKPLERQRHREPRDDPVARDFHTEHLIDLLEPVLHRVRMDTHEFRSLAAVHACVQHESLERVEQLPALVLALLP